MFCSKCGNEIKSGSNFCAKCGQPIENARSEIDSYRLKCSRCEGTMVEDEERNILHCPYCDYELPIPESEETRNLRMQAKIYREVELGKQQHEAEMRKLEIEWEEKERKRLVRIKLIGGILMTLSIAFFVFGVQYHDHSNSSNSIITFIVPQILMIVGIVFVAQKRRQRK